MYNMCTCTLCYFMYIDVLVDKTMKSEAIPLVRENVSVMNSTTCISHDDSVTKNSSPCVLQDSSSPIKMLSTDKSNEVSIRRSPSPFSQIHDGLVAEHSSINEEQTFPLVNETSDGTMCFGKDSTTTCSPKLNTTFTIETPEKELSEATDPLTVLNKSLTMTPSVMAQLG